MTDAITPSATSQADAWMKAQKGHVSALKTDLATARADLAAAREQLAAVETLCKSGVFDVNVWGERGTPFSNGAARAFARIRAALAAVPDSTNAPAGEPL